MDSLDRTIINIVNKEVNRPEEYKQAIRTAFIKEKTKSKITFVKTFITACIGIVITSGIAFAGYTVYEKVWKEPRQYNIFEEKPAVISEDEKEKIISEEKVKEDAKNILIKFGYPEEEIEKVELYRSYDEKTNSYYYISTEKEYHNETRNIGITIQFDSETGKFQYFLNNDFKDISKLENISKESAEKTAKDLLVDIGYPSDTYEIKQSEKDDNNEWRIIFSRSYNGIYNRYDNFEISFGMLNGKVIVHAVNGIVDNTFENNAFVITEQEAINIAKAKEKEFTSEPIINITAKKSIEKMNGFIYRLEKNIEDISSIKTDDTIRNVWVIRVEHKKSNRTETGVEYEKKYDSKKYFIDATTGEIIGGEQGVFTFGIE